LTSQFRESTLIMLIECDSRKREWTRRHRGLDFQDAADVFAGPTIDGVDPRYDYGEQRIRTFGALKGRWVIVVWTPRGAVRRIISMRYANEREIRQNASRVG
jgi:uncharacterized DUF497 family protein